MLYAFDGYELDTGNFELRRDGGALPMEPQVFDVLAHLVRERSRVVPKEELLDEVWGTSYVSDSALTTRIKEARRAIGDDGRAQRLIKTVHRRGYRFVGGVHERPIDGPTADATDAPESPVPVALPAMLPPPVEPASGSAVRTVGRGAELARLNELLDEAVRGSRRVVFVTGEAGLGKTTLAEAFLGEATSRAPVLVARGQCMERRGIGEPYMPVLDALARLCRGPGGDEIIDLLAKRAPSWLAQMPWLLSEARLAVLQQAAQETTRERMLREAMEALDTIASEWPLILLLEDLHWSDASTLDLLSMLARRPDPARLLVLCTYRTRDEGTHGHPVHAIAQELALLDRCERISIALLDEAATAEYVVGRLPGLDPSQSFVRMVNGRAGGNPLFLRNLVDDWIDHGLVSEHDGRWKLDADLRDIEAGLSDDLRQLIELRLEQ